MMRKITLRGLRAHPVRFIATMLAVIFGTAFLSGALVLKESVSSTFEANTTAALKNVDAAVLPDAELADKTFVTNPTVPDDLLEQVRRVTGVRAAAGTLNGSLSILGADGKAVKPRATGYLRIDDDQLNPYRLTGGAWPAKGGEIAIDDTTLTERGLKVGDRVGLATTSGKVDATITGSVSYLTVIRDGNGPNIVVSGVDAFSWLGAGESGYQAILVSADPTQLSGLTSRLGSIASDTVPPAVVQSGDEFRAEQAGASAGLANALGIGLTVFAFVALFICLFIVYNTFTTVVAQRTRELALLRAIGASGSQVRRSVFLEALVVGVTASASGLALGILLALILAKAAPGLVSAGAGGTVNLAVGIGTVIIVMVVGTIITILSAVLPAFRSARVRPLEAMRTSAVDRSGGSRVRTVIGLALTGIGIASMLAARALDQGWFLVPGPPFLFLGLLFGGPTMAAQFARIAAAIGLKRRVTSRLATDNLRRNPRRSATTANALVIGVFLVVFVTAAGGALRDYAVDFISRFGGADLNVTSENADALPADLGPKIAAIPGVKDSVAIYGNYGRADVTNPPGCPPRDPDQQGGGAVFPPFTVDLDKAESALGLKVKEGKPFTQIASGEAALQDFSAVFGGAQPPNPDPCQPGFPKLGDSMTITYSDGQTRDYKIVTLTDVSLSVPPILITPGDLRSIAPNAPVVQYSLTTEPGQADTVKAAVDQLTNDYSNVAVYEGAFVVQFLKDFFNSLISAVNALLGAAVVVAIFGIVNTLILAITERTQEIGLLRAVGMTRRQLASSIRTEAILVSLLGTLLGVVFGLFVAWCVASVVFTEGDGFSWPIRELITITIAGVVVGVGASLLPAARATRLDILESIHGA